MKIGILGSGSWGTAMAISLCELGHDVMVYGRNEAYLEEVKAKGMSMKYLPDIEIPKAIHFTSNLQEVSEGAEALILAVGSQNVRNLLNQVKPFVKEQIIVNLAKGIEISSGKTMSHVVKEVLGPVPYAVLSGPSHAEEVARKLPTTLVAASQSEEVSKIIQEAFSSPTLRIYTSDDVIGVELGGSLKNVIALGAGISDGLGYGDNTKAALMTRGMNEIIRLGKSMGAKEATFNGLTGIGDLIVTCTSMHSRNRRCGILIGEGKAADEAVQAIGMVVEGIYTIKSAYELARKKEVEMPILEELYHVIYEERDPKASVNRLMVRDYKDEV